MWRDMKNDRKCVICGKSAASGIIYCFDCRNHMNYCNEKCDPSGKNGTWDDCEKCRKCEHNMHYVHGTK